MNTSETDRPPAGTHKCAMTECRNYTKGRMCTPCFGSVTGYSSTDWIAPPPSQPVAKDERAPAGYVECNQRCGRWCKGPRGIRCNHCAHEYVGARPLAALESSYGPDWVPPLPAPPPARPTVEVGPFGVRKGDRIQLTKKGLPFTGRIFVVDHWTESAFHFTDGHTCCFDRGSSGWEMAEGWLILIAPSQPAETVKPVTLPIGRIELAKCDRCGKDDGSATMCGFDGRRVLWCTLCHFQAMAWSRRQSNDPVDFGVSLLHNPAIPERITAPKLASDWIWDTLPEAGR